METLKKGDLVPNFTSIDEGGNTVTFSDYIGKKLIVFFYPKASTPGCIMEACNLRDNYELLQKQGFELLGISADSPKRQQKFKNKYNFPFPLLADESKEVLNIFGVWGTKKFMGKTYDGIHRKTFVIDEKGIVEKVIDKVKTKDHAAQILENN